METAKKSLTVDYTPDDTITALAESLQAQLFYSNHDEKNQILELLGLKVQIMSDNQRTTLLRHFKAISAAAMSNEKSDGFISGVLEALKIELTRNNKLTVHDANLIKLRAIKKYSNPLAMYNLHKTLSKGGN